MDKFTPIPLDNYCNASSTEPYPMVGRKPHIDAWTVEHIPQLSIVETRGKMVPFIGVNAQAPKQFIVLPAPAAGDKAGDAITVPIGTSAHYVCVAHCCSYRDLDSLDLSAGDQLARYTLIYADGTEHTAVIRRLFEVSLMVTPDRGLDIIAFAAKNVPPNTIWIKPGGGSGAASQTAKGYQFRSAVWVYAMPNPHTRKVIKELSMRSLTEDGVLIFGVTLAHFPEHPLRLNPLTAFGLELPEGMEVTPAELSVSLDMGHVTGLHPAPGMDEAAWLKDPLAGIGKQLAPEKPTRRFVIEATGAGASSVNVRAKDKKYELSYREVLSKGESRSAEGARIEFCYPGKTWVHVKVTDQETGKLIATRIRFLGPRGEYLPPYGHPAVINRNWLEDEGGNLALGSDCYAYVPGEFQIELPVGNVFVELTKGFDYEPTRKKLTIEAGTRNLTLAVRRIFKMREQNYFTADPHVHLLSPQTAWLEGQCEGLNFINLMATQWGRLFTNVADITGKVNGCSEGDTTVFVGTENRHHLLGHVSLVGTKGMPVFPMCSGGPNESWWGEADIRLQSDYDDECRAKGGLVIRPHFPYPNGENAAQIVLNKLDAVEVRYFGVVNDTLDSLPIREWYKYLNCGYRLPAVGGTDKMSAEMPVGGVRTYAKLSDPVFSLDSWCNAVRAGRTFTTSGPLLGLTVEGKEFGEEIRLPNGGGTLEAEAWAVCAQPIHGLEIISNGKVVARASSKEGTRRLELKEKIKVEKSGWLAARCFSHHQVWHVWPVNMAAHTSPLYIIVDDQEIYNPTDAFYIMTMIHGSMEWLDTLSVQPDENNRRRMRSVFESAERELKGKMHHHH